MDFDTILLMTAKSFYLLRTEIRLRDDFRCQYCGRVGNKKSFNVHHVDEDLSNNKGFNLILLCESCHKRTHYDREKWKLVFTTLNELRL